MELSFWRASPRARFRWLRGSLPLERGFSSPSGRRKSSPSTNALWMTRRGAFQMSDIRCPKGHKIPHRTPYGQCLPHKCAAKAPKVSNQHIAQKMKETKAFVEKEGTPLLRKALEELPKEELPVTEIKTQAV